VQTHICKLETACTCKPRIY